MHAWNDYYPVKVQTTGGVKEIGKLNPGDQLFEYRGPGLFTVEDIEASQVIELFEVEYSDGRKAIYSRNDPIYLGMDKTITPDEIFRGIKKFDSSAQVTFAEPLGSFEQQPIDYGIMSSPHNEYPDPYTAGVMLTYASYDDEEIMLPQWTHKAHEFILNVRNYKYADKMGPNGEMGFAKQGRTDPVTWREMFPYQRFFAKSHHFADPLIPAGYQYGKINDRWEYMRGAFDAGFDPKIFIDRVGIAHTDEKRLQRLQQMMWSIGIMSIITYEPETCKDRPWILTTAGKLQRYPGIFYHPDYIAWALSRDNTIIDQQAPATMQIVSIRYLTNGVLLNVVPSNGWSHVFYDENFLPRVSKGF